MSDLEMDVVKKPRVLEFDELQELTCYWTEDADSMSCTPETIMNIGAKPSEDFGPVETIPVVCLTNGYAPVISKRKEAYNNRKWHGWRCWTGRPSIGQRKETPWKI